MPSIQAFKKNKAKQQAKSLPAKKKAILVKPTAHKAKRRPGRDKDISTEEIFMDSHAPKKKHHKSHGSARHEAEPTASAEAQHETPAAAEAHTEIHAEEPAPAQEKIEISFPGSEVLRAKLPKPFEVAEKVATDWVNDGNFEGLPLGHPLAQVLAAQGLKKAKEVEKKVVASGVIEKVAMQALTFGMKAQQEINTIRDQVKSRLGKK